MMYGSAGESASAVRRWGGPPKQANEQALPVYLINLDCSRDRLTHMKRRFANIGIDFERIPAIDGLALPEGEIGSFLRARRPRRWNYGEIGCFLSHIKAWETLGASGKTHAAIFEDDAFISAELARLLSDPSWIPANSDIVRLETTFWKTELSSQRVAVSNRIYLHRLMSLQPGTAAYIISSKAARRLTDNQSELRSTIDSSLFDFREKSCRSMNIYQLNPAPVVQEDFYNRHVRFASQSRSVIAASEWVRNSILPSRKEKVVREVVRPVRRLGANLKRNLRGSLNKSVYLKVDFCGAAEARPKRRHSPVADGQFDGRIYYPLIANRQADS